MNSNRKYYLRIVAVLTCIFLNGFTVVSVAGGNGKYISLSSAVFDILQQDFTSLEGRIEYRGPELEWMARPIAGLMANTDGALHLYSGFVLDIRIFPFLYLSPSFAPGIYFKSKSKDLNFFLEFRSQIELMIVLHEDKRIGVGFNHISNANLGKTNPGVESIAVTYHFPF